MPEKNDDETRRLDGRRVRGQATRAAAIEAATELFATQGYSATSISAIASRAGVNSASLYHAFGSKKGVLAEVVEHAGADFFEYLKGFVLGVEPLETMRRIADSLEERPLFLRLLLVMALERGEEDAELIRAATTVRKHAREVITEWLFSQRVDLPLTERERIGDELSRLVLAIMDGAFIARQLDADLDQFRRLFELSGTIIMERLAQLD